MNLRDHPLMQRYSFSAWPPVWSKGTHELRHGEIGILTKVTGNDFVPNMCFLYMEHEGDSYCGALILNDPAFCSTIIRFLQAHIGKSIREIGDLDLSPHALAKH